LIHILLGFDFGDAIDGNNTTTHKQFYSSYNEDGGFF